MWLHGMFNFRSMLHYCKLPLAQHTQQLLYLQLVTYYSMLLAWVCNAFFDTFGSENFWAQEQVTGSEAKEYFYSSIIGMETLGDDLLATRMGELSFGHNFC